MPDKSAVEVIAAVLRETLPPFDGFNHACGVAAAEIDKALGGLLRETGPCTCGLPAGVSGDFHTGWCRARTWGEPHARWVSGWTPAPRATEAPD